MLSTNTYNTFYPSYVLHHHYQVFLPLLQKVKKSSENVKPFWKSASKN